MTFSVYLILGDSRSNLFESSIINWRKHLNGNKDNQKIEGDFNNFRISVRMGGTIWNQDLGDEPTVSIKTRLTSIFAEINIPEQYWMQYIDCPENLIAAMIYKLVDKIQEHSLKSKKNLDVDNLKRLLFSTT